MSFANDRNWTSPSSDPHDEQFGDIVESIQPEAADDYDAVVVGEPYDGAIIGRPGTHKGSRAESAPDSRTETDRGVSR